MKYKKYHYIKVHNLLKKSKLKILKSWLRELMRRHKSDRASNRLSILRKTLNQIHLSAHWNRPNKVHQLSSLSSKRLGMRRSIRINQGHMQQRNKKPNQRKITSLRRIIKHSKNRVKLVLLKSSGEDARLTEAHRLRALIVNSASRSIIRLQGVSEKLVKGWPGPSNIVKLIRIRSDRNFWLKDEVCDN